MNPYMNVALYGHGFVGISIAEELKKHFNLLWLTHDDPVPSSADFIVNAAGYTGELNVDDTEKNKDKCIDANVRFPFKLESMSKVPIIHVSTGCVYDGYKDGGWLEIDPPTMTFHNGSFYSGCKGLLQDLIQTYLNRSYYFRIRLPFGSREHKKNLLTKIKNYETLVDFKNSMCSVEDLSKCIVHFINVRPTPGMYNVCNPGYAYTSDIVNLMMLEKNWMSVEEFESRVSVRRSNCVLNVDKLNKVYKMPEVGKAILNAVTNYQKDIS